MDRILVFPVKIYLCYINNYNEIVLNLTPCKNPNFNLSDNILNFCLLLGAVVAGHNIGTSDEISYSTLKIKDKKF